MCYTLETPHGSTVIVVDDNCGISKFYAIAEALSAELQISFLSQVDEAETLDWDFHYKSHILTLHYNIFNGVSIFPQNSKKVEDSKKLKDKQSILQEIFSFFENRAW